MDTTTGIQAMQHLLELYHEHIPTNFPRGFFLTTLEIVMKNNIFSFGDTFWLQLQGTAMGTPAAPLYSIITYGVHENTHILTTLNESLVYYKRYIDDIIGIWIDSPHNSWENFKNQHNGFGALLWNIDDLTTSTKFLDLTISIRDQKIHTKTFQKDLNLYLYIPPISAHPTSCFKGLIIGKVSRYWHQNSSPVDFNIPNNFILRLLHQGHLLEDLIPTLQSVAATIDNSLNHRSRHNTEHEKDETLYIHWKLHPKDVDTAKIRQLYNKTLQGHDNFTQMQIAMSRPKNLCNILCCTEIPSIPNNNASDILQKIRDNALTTPSVPP
jgi:hypothetical protein